MSVKIAIIGSRGFRDKLTVWAKLEDLKKEHTGTEGNCYMDLISGGARGVDTWAEEWADKTIYMNFKIIRPINPSEKFSYLLRNAEIVALSDKIIAFWDGKSKGTKFTIEYAKARGKEVRIIRDTEIASTKEE